MNLVYFLKIAHFHEKNSDVSFTCNLLRCTSSATEALIWADLINVMLTH